MEPDLVLDLVLAVPRLFIRRELIDIIGDDSLFQNAAYIDSTSTKAYQNFVSLSVEDNSIVNINSDTDVSNAFYYKDSLYLSEELIKEINSSNTLVDIEYRV